MQGEVISSPELFKGIPEDRISVDNKGDTILDKGYASLVALLF